MNSWEKIVRRDLRWNDLSALEAELVDRVRSDRRRRYLLVSEPRPVYTAGRNADPKGLKWAKNSLATLGIDCAEAPRGGQWTYHGPGQILAYPIVALEALGLGNRAVRPFADRFRNAVVAATRQEGLEPELRDEPYGVYLGGAKAASFGLAFHRGIVAHGVALYLTDQSEPFRRIDPCGVAEAPITSLEAHGVRLSWATAADRLATAIATAFP